MVILMCTIAYVMSRFLTFSAAAISFPGMSQYYHMRKRRQLPGPRNPLSDEIYAVRRALNESQETFAKRFNVGRTTLLDWERHSPPVHAGVQQWIKLELAKIKRAAARRKRGKERREATWQT